MESETIDRFLRALNEADSSAIQSILADNFVFEEVAGEGDPSRDALQHELGLFRAAMPDLEYRSVRLAEEPGRIYLEFRATGTQKGAFLGVPATGTFVIVSGVFNMKIAGDAIHRLRLTIDFAGLRRQLLMAARRS